MSEQQLPTPAILARGHGSDGRKPNAADRSKLLAVAFLSGCWDLMSPEDRRLWVEEATILDTPGGRALYSRYRDLIFMSASGMDN